MNLESNMSILLPSHPNMVIRIVQPDDVNQDYLDTLSDQQSTQYMEHRYEDDETTDHSGEKNNEDKQSYQRSHLKSYISEQYNAPNSFLFGLYHDNYLIATSRIHDVAQGMGWQGVLVFKKFQHQGNGRLLISHLSDYVLKTYDITSLYAGIFQKNIASQKLFSSCGFIFSEIDHSYREKRQIWVKNSV